jgi:hypothetical protein
MFRHPANGGRLDVAATTNPQLLRLFRCYPTFDRLVTDGLGTTNFVSSKLNRDGDDDSCRQLARDVIMGAIRPRRDGDHMAWNYGFYLSLVLEEQKELFMVRTENFWEDWQTIETMVGGANSTINVTKLLTGVSPVSHHRGQVKEQHLPVWSRTISTIGTHNLCCAIRVDLDVYAMTLARAVNLDTSQRQESIARVEAKCGSLDTLHNRCKRWDQGDRKGSFWSKLFGG